MTPLGPSSPPPPHQLELLRAALRDVLAQDGVIRLDADPSPELLLMAAEAYLKFGREQNDD